jgi:VWFA-related protein
MSAHAGMIAWAALAALLAWPPLPQALAQEPAPLFRTSVEAVRVDAFAHADRKPIAGLTARDFIVLDNGVEQVVDAIGTTTAAHVIIGLDTSGSVDGATLDRLRQGVQAVVTRLTSDDRLSLFTFDDRLRLIRRAAPPDADIEGALGDLRGAGRTTLHDAVIFGSALSQANALPSIFLLFTDGQDTASWTNTGRTLEALRTTNVVVYTVGEGLAPALTSATITPYFTKPTWLSPDPGDTLEILQQIADVSGGDFLRVGRGDRLATTFTNILAQYRQRYLLTYTPSGVEDRGWHRLEVRLRRRQGAVMARQGYGTKR